MGTTDVDEACTTVVEASCDMVDVDGANVVVLGTIDEVVETSLEDGVVDWAAVVLLTALVVVANSRQRRDMMMLFAVHNILDDMVTRHRAYPAQTTQ